MDPYSQILENKYRVKKLQKRVDALFLRLDAQTHRISGNREAFVELEVGLESRIDALERSKETPEAPQELGMRVYTVHRDGTKQSFRNVTEVHYRPARDHLVAFESDIHGAGCTYSLVGLVHGQQTSPIDVVEFEVFPETDLAEAF